MTNSDLLIMTNGDLIMMSEKEVSKLGISAAYKGFYYLVYAIAISVQIGMRKVCLNKEIYDCIAMINNVSRESVEKCIRNSLKKAWESSGKAYMTKCRKDGKRPTNGDVISFISNRIRLERSLRF